MAIKKVDSVKVRMYRQGFGDCFLLSFFVSKKRVFTMLIDCGIKFNTKSEDVPIKDVIEDLKNTLKRKEGEKPYLDVLVATHEHWDHVASFHPTRGENEDYFADFEIGQVWLAWTEDPDDREAATINSRLREGVAALAFAAEQLNENRIKEVNQSAPFYFGSKVADARDKFNKAMNDVMGFYGVTSLKQVSESGIKYKENGKVSSVTEEAMQNVVKLGDKGNGIKYFSPGTLVDKKLLPPGVNVYVLGPPRNSMINKSNPTHGQAQETYLSIDRLGMSGFIDGALAVGAAANNKAYIDRSTPFGIEEGLSPEEAESDEFFMQSYFSEKENYRRIDNSWLDIAGQFALQLDGAINNTSLVLAIELAESGEVLLFPGDAQVGSWLSWHDYEWEVDNGQHKASYTAEDLLKNTVLYKVSHHGSHNATVKEMGLEMMTHPDLVAMIPEKEDSYNGILYQPLVDRLHQLCKGRVIVSADVQYPPQKLLEERPSNLTATQWETFTDNLVVNRVYVEYTVRVQA